MEQNKEAAWDVKSSIAATQAGNARARTAKTVLAGGAGGLAFGGALAGAKHLYDKYTTKEKAKEAGFQGRLKEAGPDYLKYVPLSQAKAHARTARIRGLGIGVLGGSALGVAAGRMSESHHNKNKKKEKVKKAGLGVLGHRVIGASMGAAKSLGQGENLAKVLRKGTELSGGTRQLARNIGIGTVGAGVAGAGAIGFAAGSR